MTTKKKVPMHVEQAVEHVVALDEALVGARRATGNTSSSARPDPEVVAVAQRRQFSSGEKSRILALADACAQPGEIGALLRGTCMAPQARAKPISGARRLTASIRMRR